MPSYMKSMTSQLVLMVAIAITLMQLYKFFISWEVLDIFNSLSSMVLGAYFRGVISEVPDSKLNEPVVSTGDETKPSLHDINDIQDAW